jgi:hypothetical protein
MAFEIIVKPHAWFDLIEAMIWYDNRRENLGKDFFEDSEVAVERIKLNPNAFIEIIPGVKRILDKEIPIQNFLYHFR